MIVTVFYWVSLGALLCFTGFYKVLLGFTGLYWVLLGYTGFYWVLLGFIEFYWVLLGFTGFYWVLLGLSESHSDPSYRRTERGRCAWGCRRFLASFGATAIDCRRRADCAVSVDVI